MADGVGLTAAQIKEKGVSDEHVKGALLGAGHLDYMFDDKQNLRLPKASTGDNLKTNAVQKNEALIGAYDEVFASLRDAAIVMEHAGKSSADIRTKLEEAIKARQTQRARVEALRDLGNTYTAEADAPVDFAKVVEEGVMSKLATMARDTDGVLKDFDAAVKEQRAKANRGATTTTTI